MRDSFSWLVSWGIAFLILVFSMGCGVQMQVPTDRSILSDDPCAAPCWQGIVPGQTTSTEAWDILSNLEFIDHTQYPYRGNAAEKDMEYVYWRTLALENSPPIGHFYAREGIVTQIEVSVDFDLTPQEIVDKYDSPEKFKALLVGEKFLRIEVHFYYPQRGLIFVSWVEPILPLESFSLEPTIPIKMAYYFQPASMDNLFAQIPQYSRRLSFGYEDLMDWKGFGPVDVLH